jgi:hypothetical protein
MFSFSWFFLGLFLVFFSLFFFVFLGFCAILGCFLKSFWLFLFFGGFLGLLLLFCLIIYISKTNCARFLFI